MVEIFRDQRLSGGETVSNLWPRESPSDCRSDLGLTLRDLVERNGGGMRDEIPFRVCQTGGASFGLFTADHLDTPMIYVSMPKRGGTFGSGTMLVMNEKTCVVDVVRNVLHFFQHEPCGSCKPCRRGIRILFETISRITAGDGCEQDLNLMIDLARTMAATASCAPAMSPMVFIKSTIDRFNGEYVAHIPDRSVSWVFLEPEGNLCAGCA